MPRTTTNDPRNDGAKLRKTTGPASPHERRNAQPGAGDLTDPKEVWKEGETTPQEQRPQATKTGHGRVANAGDLAGRASGPYDPETQADMVAKQTDRRKPAGGSSKPSTPRKRS